MIMLPANFFWRGLPVDVVVPVGKQPKTKALDWLIKFCAEKRRPLVYQIGDDWFAFGPAAFREDIANRLARGEQPWEKENFT